MAQCWNTLKPRRKGNTSVGLFINGTWKKQIGKYDHLIIWSYNVPAQFKECFLFFYLKTYIKFLLKENTYSYSDRQFGVIQTFFQRQKVVDIPRKWAKVLEQGNLCNVAVHGVSLEIMKVVSLSEVCQPNWGLGWWEDWGQKQCMAKFWLQEKSRRKWTIALSSSSWEHFCTIGYRS